MNFSEGEYYHLYNRGTDKRVIFLEEHDYKRFVALLYICNSVNSVDITKHFREGGSFNELFEVERTDTLVDVGTYCLMPNHFHILVREKREGGVVKFMLKLSTAYSMYFNKRNERTGSLFEGKFKAKHADTDEYLKYLFAYIHLNPVKMIDSKWKENMIIDREKALSYLGEYAYSSFLDYQGKDRVEQKILNRDVFPEYFVSVEDFDAFVGDWLSFGE